MNPFRIWAPHAERMRLRLSDQTLDMTETHNGWWTVSVSGLKHGDRYGFLINNDEQVLPDPRSPWQPGGVHDLSAWVDHAKYTWGDQGWRPPPLGSALLYELHIGTFTDGGTFESAVERLNDLAELGITHVELMPVNEFSGDRGWGYDGVDLYAPHHAYGGPHGLKMFVDACHQRGLAVILDVVYNHLGPSGNYLARFGPYFSNRYHTPWGDAVNLDGSGSDEVRRFFIDNALMWLRDYHMDGLRVDAVHSIFDQSAVHFLELLKHDVSALSVRLGKELPVIAESDLNDPRLIRPLQAGGYGLDAQWTDDIHHALHAFYTGERIGYYIDFGTLAAVAKALKHAFINDGRYSSFRNRRHGRPVGDLPGDRFVTFLQNHDQVGNRAYGERLHHLAGINALKQAAALLFTSPYIPLVFQGEEWAASTPFYYFTSHPEQDLGEAVTQGRRREFSEFGWEEEIPNPQDIDTFEASRLNWEERSEPEHEDILNWYKALIRIRNTYPELINGDRDSVQIDFDEQHTWLRVQRGRVVVICNTGAEKTKLNAPHADRANVLLKSRDSIVIKADSVTLPAESVIIYCMGESSDAQQLENMK
ncbi:MAG: malto-oligosyltrehalose trehalohydrolase [candidate division KSB1 bacterium]|nr:malto-oligosyltrehalose trehalohydrolase [candidate division KSB1 bacterium]